MNFFEAQSNARANTFRLIALFALAVISLILIAYGLILLVHAYLAAGGQAMTLDFVKSQFSWQVFGLISLAMVSVVLVSSIYKITSLQSGGKVIAESLGGTLVHHLASAPDELVSEDGVQSHEFKVQRLLNVVEEMAIASGTPVPAVYIMKEERGINAFAAGFTIDDAVVGITQGALEEFDREELQGVIAHEFSHILNGDMRLNMRLIGILHGILVVGIVGHHIISSTRHTRSKESGNIALLGIGLLLIGYTGTFFGNMIKAGISRQREFLADASAVQFTRNHRGIANALNKIGMLQQRGFIEHADAPSISHAFFANAVSSKLQSIFATHPPLEKRIKRINPRFMGKFENSAHTSNKSSNNSSASSNLSSTTTGASSAAGVSSLSSAPISGIATIDALHETVGQLTAANIQSAQMCLSKIPASIRALLRSPSDARACVYAMLLNNIRETDIKRSQLSELETQLDIYEYDDVLKALAAFEALDVAQRLPVIEILLPQLKRMTKVDFERFESNIDRIVAADQQVDLFEWCIGSIVKRYLQRNLYGAGEKGVKYREFKHVQDSLNVYVHTLVFQFVASEQFDEVISALPKKFQFEELTIDKSQAQNFVKFDAAIKQLNHLDHKLKEQLLKCAVYVMSCDKVLSYDEIEAIRAISESLSCPMAIPSTSV